MLEGEGGSCKHESSGERLRSEENRRRVRVGKKEAGMSEGGGRHR